MCVCACACVCVQACAGLRVCVRMCVVVVVVCYYLSLSLSKGWLPTTCECDKKSNQNPRPVTSTRNLRKPLSLQCNRRYRQGFERGVPSLAPAPKGGPGAGGCGDGRPAERDSLPIDQPQTGPSSPPSCPLGKPDGVLEGGDSGPGGPARLRPGSRGGGWRTG